MGRQGEGNQALPAGMILALAAVRGPSRPLSPAELAEFNTLRAREMARAEARRCGQYPQAPLPLDGAA